jgi:hypothetical protein
MAGRVRSIEKSNDLIRIRSHDLPACSIVPQPSTLPHDPLPLSIELMLHILNFTSFCGQ